MDLIHAFLFLIFPKLGSISANWVDICAEGFNTVDECCHKNTATADGGCRADVTPDPATLPIVDICAGTIVPVHFVAHSYDAEGEIIKMCVEHNIKWERVKGPSYEKPIGSAKSKY